MAQVVLHIDSKKKWNAIRAVLEAMEIDYTTEDAVLGKQETELLRQAEQDVVNGRLSPYTNHRDILSRQ